MGAAESDICHPICEQMRRIRLGPIPKHGRLAINSEGSNEATNSSRLVSRVLLGRWAPSDMEGGRVRTYYERSCTRARMTHRSTRVGSSERERSQVLSVHRHTLGAKDDPRSVALSQRSQRCQEGTCQKLVPLSEGMVPRGLLSCGPFRETLDLA